MPNLPLQKYALPTAYGVEQCREAVAHFLCDNKVDARGDATNFNLHMHMAPLSQSIALGVLHWTSGAYVRATNSGDCHNFVNLLSGRGRFSVAGHEIDHVPWERAAVVAPERPSAAISDDAVTALCVRVDRSLAESHLKALTGVEPTDGIEFDPAMQFTGEAGSIWRFVYHIVEEIGRDASILRNPLVTDHLSDALLTGLLFAQPHNYSELLVKPTPPAAPSYVRRAEEYMEAHCDEPITAKLLAGAIGVSVRTLYAGFRKHRDCAPIEFLRSMRLRRARAALLTAPPDSSVSECAMKWGFTHLGRFSAQYREQFGESPSETLRRSRR